MEAEIGVGAVGVVAAVVAAGVEAEVVVVIETVVGRS